MSDVRGNTLYGIDAVLEMAEGVVHSHCQGVDVIAPLRQRQTRMRRPFPTSSMTADSAARRRCVWTAM